jgi:hypothetical protein
VPINGFNLVVSVQSRSSKIQLAIAEKRGGLVAGLVEKLPCIGAVGLTQ